MSIEQFYIHDVTVKRAVTVTNRYNNSERVWANATETPLRGWKSQREATEPAEAGRPSVTVTQDILFVPADADIRAHDRVEVLDTEWDVDGVPHEAWTPRGLHHLEVKLRAVEG